MNSKQRRHKIYRVQVDVAKLWEPTTVTISDNPGEALRAGVNLLLFRAGLPTLDDDDQPLEPANA